MFVESLRLEEITGTGDLTRPYAVILEGAPSFQKFGYKPINRITFLNRHEMPGINYFYLYIRVILS